MKVIKRAKSSILMNWVTLTLAFVSGPNAMAKKEKANSDALATLKENHNNESQNNLKALQAEMLIATQELKAIDQVNKLLKKYKGTALEADLLMRLAELHIRRAKTDRFLEMHRSSEEIVKFAPKAIDSAASKKQMVKGIELFGNIERRFPGFDKLDSVVFNNAFANQQIGNNDEAARIYGRLVRNFPESALLPDSHLALGEIQFSNKNFKTALEHFEAIKQYPDSVVYPYGVYKAAWTYYNLRQTEQGLVELENVVKYGRFIHEQGIDSRLDIRKEALMDMALFFEDIRPSKEAFRYLDKQAGDLDPSPAILRLADLYKRHGRHQDIKVVLTEFVKRRPYSSEVPSAYVELMDASEKLNKPKDVVTLLAQFSSICKVDARWTKEQVDTTMFAKCKETFERVALGYANKWLKLWDKTKSKNDLADSIEQAFVIYLNSNPEAQAGGRARFVYAELLFKRQKYREASTQYTLVSQVIQDKTLGHDSRYFALAALEKAVKDNKWIEKDEKQFQKLAKEYLSKNPDGQFALDIEFKVALIAYENGRYEEAAPTFFKLGNLHSGQEKGLRSQDLYLDTLNYKKDYLTLRDYSKNLMAKAKDDRYTKLKKIYEEAYFLIVQTLEEKGKYNEAIEQYDSFAKADPKAPLTQKALWNIIQLYYKSGNQISGADAAVTFFNKYSDSKEGVDALMKAAQTYEGLGQLKLAAQVLQKLALADAKNQNKWNLLAADFYLLAGDIGRAKPVFMHIRKQADKDMAFRALEQLEQIARIAGNPLDREAYLEEIAKSERQPKASLAGLYFAKKAYDQNKIEEAYALAKKVIAQRKSGADRSALAQASLIHARILNKEFIAQSVKTKLERIQKVLTIKTEKLSKAQVAFQSAASYGDPLVAVEAYKELADSYLHYSDALRSMPIPAGIPIEESDAFRAEMEKLSIPMEEKGIDAKVQAFQIAQEHGVHDKVVTELQDEMKKLNQKVVKDIGVVKVEPAGLVLPKPEGLGT